ncbi:MAG TPA: LptE family protein [Methylomirabilota bacterium]|nr:LptE family protein [Methylomirabilota bacterium]
MTRRLGAVLLVLAAGTLAGCGYSFRGTLPDHVRTVAVPIFLNRTPEPGVESIITRAIVQAFATNGRLQVTRPADADAILDGEVTSYGIQAIAFDETLNVQQYRLVVTLNLRMRDVRRNTVLFQQTGVTEQADFRVIGPVAATITREESALTQAAAEIARSVVSLAIDRF